MSISSARNFIERSGCGWILGGVLAIVMIASIFNSSTCNRQGEEGPPEEQIVLASVGDRTVTMNEFSDMASRQLEGMRQGEQGLDPLTEGRFYADLAQGLVSRALVFAVAKEKGIDVTDDELRAEHKKNNETQLLQARMSLMQSNAIKPDATEAEFAAAFEKMAGRSLEQFQKEVDEEFEKSLQDPARRRDMAYSLLGRKVTDSYKAAVTLTDADLKKGFETYSTKRIIAYLDGSAKDKEKRAKIVKALSEVRAGKNFETAMNEYSDDPAPPGKKSKSESTIDLPYSALTYDPSLAPILKLKLGQVSDIVETSSGPAIFKLYKIESRVPADFEKQKDSIRAGRTTELASKAASEDLRKRLGSVKYESPVLEALVEWRVLATDPKNFSDRKKLAEETREIYERLKTATDPKIDPRVQRLGAYAVFDAYYNELPPSQQASLEAERLEIMNQAAQDSVHVETLHEIVKLAAKRKERDIAVTALKNAMDSNAGIEDLAVARHKGQIALRGLLAGAGLLNPSDAKLLDEALQRWRTDVADALRLAAQSNADFTPTGEAEYKRQVEKVSQFEKAGYLTADAARELRTEIQKWKAGVFDDLKLAIESNTDYSELGESSYTDLKGRVDKFAAVGYLSPAQKSQLTTLLDKWKPGAFEQLKKEIEANRDYTAAGQATFSDLGSRIDRYMKAGIVTAAQRQQLLQLQERWKAEKKKADAGGNSAGPAPRPGSGDLLGPPAAGGTTGG